MSETFCGKSCEACQYQEKLSCPGCAEGPGKRYYGDCALAKCCYDKGHKSCETCQLSGHCGVLRGRERIPEQRIRQQEEKKRLLEAAAARSPILGKWLWILFWLVVPSTVASLMTNETILEALPALKMPGAILQSLVVLAKTLILLKLSGLEPRYQKAAIYGLIGGGVGILAALLPSANATGWTLLLTIPAAIVSYVGMYNEFHGHAAVLMDVDIELSEKWDILWKWNIGLTLGIFGCILLAAIVPILGLLVMIAAAIGLIVVGIMQMVYLYRTAKAFRDFSPAPES